MSPFLSAMPFRQTRCDTDLNRNETPCLVSCHRLPEAIMALPDCTTPSPRPHHICCQILEEVLNVKLTNISSFFHDSLAVVILIVFCTLWSRCNVSHSVSWSGKLPVAFSKWLGLFRFTTSTARMWPPPLARWPPSWPMTTWCWWALAHFPWKLINPLVIVRSWFSRKLLPVFNHGSNYV